MIIAPASTKASINVIWGLIFTRRIDSRLREHFTVTRPYLTGALPYLTAAAYAPTSGTCDSPQKGRTKLTRYRLLEIPFILSPAQRGLSF
jgi:hypothetical protein